jgi:CheY-like chemotaxis protein
VVVNLLSNAAKYTPRGGRIEVGVTALGEQLRIVVQDNGSGIEAELLPQVFDIFKQGKRTLDRSEGGLGIGLTLVKSLVSAHGGSVLAHSGGPGLGSRFEVLLPACRAADAAPDAAPAQPPAGAGQRILVVDDNTDAAETLGQLLEVLGNEVRVCFDGRSALALAPAFQPAILILDVGLPDMNGYQLAARLRGTAPLDQALYIALTGYGQEHDRAQSRAAGFQHHLVKPVDLGLLMQALEARPAT